MEYRPASRSLRGDAGAVLVEASLILLLLAFIGAGIVEYAAVFAGRIDVENAVRSGARAASFVTISGPNSDYNIVQSVLQKAGSKRDNVDKIIIYFSATGQTEPSVACKTATTTPAAGEKCNVYTKADFAKEKDQFDAMTVGKGWPPSARVQGSDYIGVYVEATRQPLFKGLGAPTSIHDHLTMRLPVAVAATPGSDWKTAAPGEQPKWTSKVWGCWDGRECYEDHDGGGIGGDPGDSGSG